MKLIEFKVLEIASKLLFSSLVLTYFQITFCFSKIIREHKNFNGMWTWYTTWWIYFDSFKFTNNCPPSCPIISRPRLKVNVRMLLCSALFGYLSAEVLESLVLFILIIYIFKLFTKSNIFEHNQVRLRGNNSNTIKLQFPLTDTSQITFCASCSPLQWHMCEVAGK